MHKERLAAKKKRPKQTKPKQNEVFLAATRKLKNVTPIWANKKYISLFYELAKEENAEIDHIVPINHPLVCGLHVEYNLQVVTREYNQYKSNRFWPNMPKYDDIDYESMYERYSQR